MDESRISFLRRLIDSPSPSSFEQPIQQVIREEIQHYTDFEKKGGLAACQLIIAAVAASPRDIAPAAARIVDMDRSVVDRGAASHPPDMTPEEGPGSPDRRVGTSASAGAAGKTTGRAAEAAGSTAVATVDSCRPSYPVS